MAPGRSLLSFGSPGSIREQYDRSRGRAALAVFAKSPDLISLNLDGNTIDPGEVQAILYPDQQSITILGPPEVEPGSR